MSQPLPYFLRPSSLAEFVGQKHLLGEQKPLRSFLESGAIPSMIFRGPPGVGKTTLAHIISKQLDAEFYHMSGVTSKKDDLKKIIEKAKQNQDYNINTIVFLDEVHRWNKAQQDTLLPYVEDGTIIFIGATTENPSFTINNALLSRCRVFVFEKLDEDTILEFLQKNITKVQKKYPNIVFEDEHLELISKLGNGDLRNALNVLESALLLISHETNKKNIKKTVKNKTLEMSLSKDIILQACEKMVYHDRNGEEHYNIISAIHKSLRDSDPDAACYRIQRMLSAGEDPLYVARRLLRFASEDIGPADNNALLLANQTYDAISKIWMPECDVFLFQLAIYLAKAPKNNIAYRVAIATRKDIQEFGNLPVPIHLRNSPTKLMKNLDYGKDYKYAHDFKDAKVDQEHFPKELKGRKYM